jgi:hypothetical protein
MAITVIYIEDFPAWCRTRKPEVGHLLCESVAPVVPPNHAMLRLHGLRADFRAHDICLARRLRWYRHGPVRLVVLAAVFDYLRLGPLEFAELLPAAEPRLGRRTALTLPLLPPPQKN